MRNFDEFMKENETKFKELNQNLDSTRKRDKKTNEKISKAILNLKLKIQKIQNCQITPTDSDLEE